MDHGIGSQRYEGETRNMAERNETHPRTNSDRSEAWDETRRSFRGPTTQRAISAGMQLALFERPCQDGEGWHPSRSNIPFNGRTPVTLIQTDKIKPFPVILFGKDHWGGLVDWMERVLVKRGFIQARDMNIFYLTDDPDEVVRKVRESPALARRP